jgi:hypothetical protein
VTLSSSQVNYIRAPAFRTSPGGLLAVTLAGLLLAVAYSHDDPTMGLGLALLALSLVAGVVLRWIKSLVRPGDTQQLVDVLASALAHDPVAKLLADPEGRIFYRNNAALDPGYKGKRITDILDPRMADSRDLLARLQGRLNLKDAPRKM